MIVFELECINGHSFEGWFEDSKTFMQQQENGEISCPVCNSVLVEQKLSPVAVKTSSGSPMEARRQANEAAIAELAEKINEFVEKNFEDVGTNFAKEALKMHYGASDKRNIRGSTTVEEDKILEKEGVPVIKFPLPPKPEDDMN